MSKKPPNATDIFVGQRVRMARLMKGLSQEKLAAPLGLTFQQVQKYEKGTNRIGSSRLAQISEIVGQPVSWFFDEQAAGKKHPGTDIVGQMLTMPYGLDLARAFVAIAHNNNRHVVMEVARAIVEAQQASSSQKAA